MNVFLFSLNVYNLIPIKKKLNQLSLKWILVVNELCLEKNKKDFYSFLFFLQGFFSFLVFLEGFFSFLFFLEFYTFYSKAGA